MSRCATLKRVMRAAASTAYLRAASMCAPTAAASAQMHALVWTRKCAATYTLLNRSS